jgi:hypothetical protein
LMLFLSKRFSRVRSATTSFKAEVSRRRSFTSPEVAARAVSPANRRLASSARAGRQHSVQLRFFALADDGELAAHVARLNDEEQEKCRAIYAGAGKRDGRDGAILSQEGR